MTIGEAMSTDVLIVGSGAAGVTAAIEVREAGADVIVLEREDHFGGAAAISGGGCCIVGSPLQQRNGIEDDTDLAFNDLVKFGGGAADEEWARFYLENTLQGLYQWAEERGVRWMRLQQFEGNSVPRWHQPEGWGRGLWQALHKYSVSKGANKWLANTTAREFILDKGRVVGVRTENTETGEGQEFYAKAIVMGSGGFSSNIDMVYKYRPDLAKYHMREGGHVGARGEGHQMVEGIGGTLTHMDEIWSYCHAIPDHINPKRGYVTRLMPESMWIWVNLQGHRYHNESLHSGATGTPALLAQEPAESWAILDSAMFDSLHIASPEFYLENPSKNDPEKIARLFEESPHIKTSDSLANLAAQMGVPTETMVETVRQYNSDIDQGLEHDSAFGRSLKGMSKIEEPPFHAFHFMPLARKTLGGVKTNLQCQALDKYYQPIPGLYAAGELAGMAGGHINGKSCLEGTMLGPSLFSGRVAGAWAAKDAGFGNGFLRPDFATEPFIKTRPRAFPQGLG